MKNTLREASYYQLAFRNNLTLTELEGKVGLLGLNKDLENFYKGIEEKEEDYYWKNDAKHSEDYDGLDRHLGYVMNQVEEETIEDSKKLDEDGDDLLGDKLRAEHQSDMEDDMKEMLEENGLDEFDI